MEKNKKIINFRRRTPRRRPSAVAARYVTATAISRSSSAPSVYDNYRVAAADRSRRRRRTRHALFSPCESTAPGRRGGPRLRGYGQAGRPAGVLSRVAPAAEKLVCACAGVSVHACARAESIPPKWVNQCKHGTEVTAGSRPDRPPARPARLLSAAAPPRRAVLKVVFTRVS